MSHECCYCGSFFSSKSILKTHTQTAKYCLVKQDIQIFDIECEYCKHLFTQKGSLKTHLKICETRLNIEKSNAFDAAKIEKNTELRKKNKELKKRDAKINKLEKTLKIKDARIVELEKTLEFEKGKSAGYQISKPSTVVNKNCNNNVSSKLSHIQITTIKPFTIESISEVLPLYTEACFRNKLHGIMSLILPITTLDVNGVIERNIVCTDLARTVCHRLTDDREWLRDDGLSICKDILRLFAPSMTPYVMDYKEKFEEAERTLNSESHSLTKSIHYPHARRDFDNYFEILEDVRTDFYTPIIQEFGENYDTLIKNFRDLLKPAVYVRTIKATPG